MVFFSSYLKLLCACFFLQWLKHCLLISLFLVYDLHIENGKRSFILFYVNRSASHPRAMRKFIIKVIKRQD
jgi:hypothetical protein